MIKILALTLRTMLIRGLLGGCTLITLANAQTAPGVTDFGPKNMQRDVRQVRMRFSNEMVALGDSRAADPANVRCTGTEDKIVGHWIDGRNWAGEFKEGLPDGVVCTVTPMRLTTLKGEIVSMPQVWAFNTGGPKVLAIGGFHASQYGETVLEEPVSMFKVSVPVDMASLKNLGCRVAGENLPVQILSDIQRMNVLSRLDIQAERDTGHKTHYVSSNAEELIIAQCGIHPWPNSTEVTWIWGKNIRSKQGVSNIADTPYRLQVRPAFTYQVMCQQLTGSAGCDPRQEITFKFTEEVDKLIGEKITLKSDQGGIYSVPQDRFGDHDKSTMFSFLAPFHEGEKLTPDFPLNFTDAYGRKLTGERDAKEPIAISHLPAYLGMAKTRGVMPWKPGSNVLWALVTRNTEKSIPVRTWKFSPALQTIPTLLALHQLSVEGSLHIPDAVIQKKPFAFSTALLKSFLKSFGGAKPRLVKQTVTPTSPTLEFVGIPLSGYGTWLVEADSPNYRSALELQGAAAKKPPRQTYQYGASSHDYFRPNPELETGRVALVQLTNLNIHARISSSDQSLIWVTAVDTGKPIANAIVEVWSCAQKKIMQARTDEQGRVLVDKLVLPTCLPVPPSERMQPLSPSQRRSLNSLWIVAHKGQDIALLPASVGVSNSNAVAAIGHTVLDRVLFHAGETVSMQTLVRLPTADGWTIPTSQTGKVAIYFNNQDLVYEGNLTWDKDGTALSTWQIPASAKLGQYRFVVKDRDNRPLSSGKFQVEEFRNPVFDARLNGATTWIRDKQMLTLASRLDFMAGGPAANEQVVLKGRYEPGAIAPVPGYYFTDAELVPGSIPDFLEQKVALNKNGQQSSLIDAPIENGPITLHAEMQFKDPNGETQTQGTQVALWPKRQKIGLNISASSVPNTAEIAVVLLDENNHPVENRSVTVDAAGASFLVYSNVVASVADGDRFPVCTIQTDAEGKGRCVVPWTYKTTRSHWLIRAHAEGASTASSMRKENRFTWIRGNELLERVSKVAPKINEPDRLRFHAPFLPATVLLTIEREGILASHVFTLTKEEEEIDVPMQINFAPSVNLVAHFVRGSDQLDGTKGASTNLTTQTSLGIVFDQITHRLQVDVRTKESTAHPGETVQTTIKVVHAITGKVAAGARVTVVAFDDALTALKPNLTWSVMNSFWNQRYSLIFAADLDSYGIGSWAFGKKPDYFPPFEKRASHVAIYSGSKKWGGNIDDSSTPRSETLVVTGFRASSPMSLARIASDKNTTDSMMSEDMGAFPDNQIDLAPRTDFSSLALWKTDIVLNDKGEATVAIPLRDSLTRWRIVAIAMEGTDRYGYGSTFIQTRKNIQILSGLPQTVRSNDVLRQKLTLRNTTDQAVTVQLHAQAKATINPDIPQTRDPVPEQAMEGRGLKIQRTVALAAHENQVVEWPVTIPDGMTQLDWQIRARVAHGKDSDDGDALDIKQIVMPAAPVTIRESTIIHVDTPQSITVAQPAGARPGTGAVAVRWQASLAEAAISGARHWMRNYPFGCMEQLFSKAAVSGDPTQWEKVMALLPTYLDATGLVRYFPSTNGSEILTAYLLDITDAYQLSLPPVEKAKMQNALRLALAVENKNDWLPDNNTVVYRLALQAAIAPNLGAAKPTIPADLNTLPTIALLDWVRYVLTTPDTGERTARLNEAANQLRNRYDMQGTRLVWREQHPYNLWWMMWTQDVATARTAFLAQQWMAVDARWKDDVPRLILSLVDKQRQGSWDTTTSNAWSVAALQRFTKETKKGPITGTSRATFGGTTNEQSWPKPEKVVLAWPQQDARGVLDLRHIGTGAPWAIVQILAAMKLDAPLAHGVTVKKTISAIEQRTKGQWSEGDVMKIALEISSQSDLSWLVVHDPIPSGATILGKSLGGESQLALAAAHDDHGWWRPSFEERANDSYRGYYQRVWRGTWLTSYIVRLNNVGTFNFPATRVEAMYSPEIFAETPNPTLEVKP